MSYSLHNLDLKMEKYLKDIENGYYIESGANDGITQSNTLYYNQKYNWKGILIEANPTLAEKCKNNRPLDIVENYALVDDLYKKEKISGYFQNISLNGQCIENNNYSDNSLSPNQIIDVNAITLTSLLDKHNVQKIDFFSLDVEGYEINVLNGLNFEKYRPKYILIETTSCSNRKKETLDYLLGKNYKFLEELSVNDALFISF
jgi:FkbM family methyltransferase